MNLKDHPLICHRTPDQIRFQMRVTRGPEPVLMKHENLLKEYEKSLERYHAVPRHITASVFDDLTEADSDDEFAEEISKRHKDFLETASDRQLMKLILHRIIQTSAHVDPDVWIQRVDDALHNTLGLPSGLLLDETDNLFTKVLSAYEAHKDGPPYAP